MWTAPKKYAPTQQAKHVRSSKMQDKTAAAQSSFVEDKSQHKLPERRSHTHGLVIYSGDMLKQIAHYDVSWTRKKNRVFRQETFTFVLKEPWKNGHQKSHHTSPLKKKEQASLPKNNCFHRKCPFGLARWHVT